MIPGYAPECSKGIKCRNYRCHQNHPPERKPMCQNSPFCLDYVMGKCEGKMHPHPCDRGYDCDDVNCTKYHGFAWVFKFSEFAKDSACRKGASCTDAYCLRRHPLERAERVCLRTAFCHEPCTKPHTTAVNCESGANCTNPLCPSRHPANWAPGRYVFLPPLNPSAELYDKIDWQHEVGDAPLKKLGCAVVEATHKLMIKALSNPLASIPDPATTSLRPVLIEPVATSGGKHGRDEKEKKSKKSEKGGAKKRRKNDSPRSSRASSVTTNVTGYDTSTSEDDDSSDSYDAGEDDKMKQLLAAAAAAKAKTGPVPPNAVGFVAGKPNDGSGFRPRGQKGSPKHSKGNKKRRGSSSSSSSSSSDDDESGSGDDEKQKKKKKKRKSKRKDKKKSKKSKKKGKRGDDSDDSTDEEESENEHETSIILQETDEDRAERFSKLLRDAQAATTRKVGVVIDANYFVRCVEGIEAKNSTASLHATVRKALEETLALLAEIFETTLSKVYGYWMDTSKESYFRYARETRGGNPGLLRSAIDKDKNLTSMMNPVLTDTPLRNVQLCEVGEMQRQGGWPDQPGATERKQFWVQKGVDAAVVCKVIELKISNIYDRLVLIAGDGDLAHSFDICNKYLQPSTGPLGGGVAGGAGAGPGSGLTGSSERIFVRVCGVKSSLSKAYGIEGRLGEPPCPPIYLDQKTHHSESEKPLEFRGFDLFGRCTSYLDVKQKEGGGHQQQQQHHHHRHRDTKSVDTVQSRPPEQVRDRSRDNDRRDRSRDDDEHRDRSRRDRDPDRRDRSRERRHRDRSHERRDRDRRDRDYDRRDHRDRDYDRRDRSRDRDYDQRDRRDEGGRGGETFRGGDVARAAPTMTQQASPPRQFTGKCNRAYDPKNLPLPRALDVANPGRYNAIIDLSGNVVCSAYVRFGQCRFSEQGKPEDCYYPHIPQDVQHCIQHQITNGKCKNNVKCRFQHAWPLPAKEYNQTCSDINCYLKAIDKTTGSFDPSQVGLSTCPLMHMKELHDKICEGYYHARFHGCHEPEKCGMWHVGAERVVQHFFTKIDLQLRGTKVATAVQKE